MPLEPNPPLSAARRRLARVFLPVLDGTRAMAGEDAPRLAAVRQFERAVTALRDGSAADLQSLAEDLAAETLQPEGRA